MPRTADWRSRSAQICWNDEVSAQIPPQPGHSESPAPPTTTAFISARQRGQSSEAGVLSPRSALAPQCEQNFEPIKIVPKQDGQATVASGVPQ